MKEDFLHYVWKFQKFVGKNLTTTKGDSLVILQVGTHNHNAGPDFLMAEIQIGTHKWIGQIELHVKSSLWYVHDHQKDINYDTVILHVVWTHDVEVKRTDGSIIPTLVLKGLISPLIFNNYQSLFAPKTQWLHCEQKFTEYPEIAYNQWLTRLFMERLEQKTQRISEALDRTNNHWEAVLLFALARAFGMKVNATSFGALVTSLDYRIVQKVAENAIDLEALLLGRAGLLDSDLQDKYLLRLQLRYAYLLLKYKWEEGMIPQPQFFRLRPHNFPTIRLSQLAVLWHSRRSFFSEVLVANSVKDLLNLLKVKAADYWDSHYVFGKATKPQEKWLSKTFREHLVINAILPIKYAYAKFVGKDISEEIIRLAKEMSSEQNKVVKHFSEYRKLQKTAYESQALIRLHGQYCSRNNCLQCEIGKSFLAGDH